MSIDAATLLTTIEPVPAGFKLIKLTKRDLLAGPVVVLVPDIADLAHVMDDYAQRLLGIVITTGPGVKLEQIAPLAWHATLPVEWLGIAASLVPGWLAAIATADDANQRVFAAEFRTERIARELQVTRHDYNELTTRLLDQVRDLLAAKTELSHLNENLESRVAERTVDLAHANANLSHALDDLRRTQDELVRAAKLAGLGSLVAGIAHELNTPIGNGVTVASSLAHEARMLKSKHVNAILKRSELDRYLHDVEEITVVLERNLLRAADIIGHFKQLTADQVSENRRRFKLVDVISDTMSALSPQLRMTPYRVVLQLDATLDMDSYPGAISQVLTNFVTNALMHAFDGRDAGVMTIGLVAHGDDQLELSFGDDGNGIAADKIGRIFDPFFTTRFGQGGSGLGLYIAYNQVQELLGGRLTVSSEVGQGTCFSLLLPRTAPVRGAAE